MPGRAPGSLGERTGRFGHCLLPPPWSEDGVSLTVAAAGPPEGGDVQPSRRPRGVSGAAGEDPKVPRV